MTQLFPAPASIAQYLFLIHGEFNFLKPLFHFELVQVKFKKRTRAYSLGFETQFGR
jgi:hypothetical protein